MRKFVEKRKNVRFWLVLIPKKLQAICNHAAEIQGRAIKEGHQQ